MKNIIRVLFVIICPSTLFGQNELNSLRAPTSPASSVLGLQPSTVLSPKSYQSLETALYSNFLNSEGKAVIPNDFALEFTPYWTKNHGLSLEDYLYPNSACEQIARNSSFSIASTQNFLLGDSTASNGLAFGYRTTFYFGNENDRKEVKESITKLRSNKRIQNKIKIEAIELVNRSDIKNSTYFLDGIKSVITNAIIEYGNFDNIEDAKELTSEIYKEAKNLPILDKENPDNFLNAFYDLVDTKLNAENIFNHFESYIKERQGFSIDLAYAGLINFPTNNFEVSVMPRQSFWITPTYRFKDNWSFLKVMCAIRYEWYNLEYYKKYFPKNVIYENNTDYGLAVSGEFKKFSIQFEAVGRNSNSEIPAGTDNEGNELFRKEQNKDFQYIGSFNYNLRDQIVMTYSLGNRFKPIQNPNNTIVSLLTLNFGFGSPTKADLDLEK